MKTKTQEQAPTTKMEPRPQALRVRTALKSGATIAWTYTNGGVTHEDTWNQQT